MKNKSRISTFLLALLCSGCTDDAKIDRIQAKLDLLGQILQKQDELRSAATPSVVVLTDVTRAQQVCVLGTARPISVGETIFITDDIWRVEAVKHLTEEVSDKLRNANVQKLYKISYTQLLVSFQGKATKTPQTQEPKKNGDAEK